MDWPVLRSVTLLRVICVFALVMIGFAHRPVAADPVKLQFAAYILPDGTLPTLCLNEAPTQPEKGVLYNHGCEACRLSAAILLPEPPSIAAQAAEFATVARTIERQYELELALYPPSSGPRAPPSSVILA
jgi:hypothetical protein